MEKRIGIVLDSWKNGIITGHLADDEVELEINEQGLIQIKQVISKRSFTYNISTGIFQTENYFSWESSKQIGFELKKIGFETVKLLYKGDIYEILENYNVIRTKIN